MTPLHAIAAALRHRADRAMVSIELGAAAGFAMLAGSGFLLAALHIALWRAWGPVAASLILGALLWAVGATLLLVVLRRNGHPEPAVPTSEAPPEGAAATAAFVAGFVLARQFMSRK